MELELDFVEKASVLAVDDTPENLTLMGGLLKNDYKVRLANSGAKARTARNTISKGTLAA